MGWHVRLKRPGAVLFAELAQPPEVLRLTTSALDEAFDETAKSAKTTSARPPFRDDGVPAALLPPSVRIRTEPRRRPAVERASIDTGKRCFSSGIEQEMNHNYRVIWSRSHNAFVVASELTRSKGQSTERTRVEKTCTHAAAVRVSMRTLALAATASLSLSGLFSTAAWGATCTDTSGTVATTCAGTGGGNGNPTTGAGGTGEDGNAGGSGAGTGTNGNSSSQSGSGTGGVD